MKVSIITINYNNLSGLKKTRESIVSQTYNDYEWIVIDGGSTDGAKDFLQEHADEMSYWCSEKDEGVYNAQNKGIKKAKGDYVICMNSGDSFHNSSVLEEVFSHNQTADILYGDWLRVYPDGKTEKKEAPQVMPPYFFYYDNICHQAMFVKTSVMQEFPFDESYRIYADWAKWQELCQKGCSFCYVPLVVCDFEASVGLSEKTPTRCHEEKNRMQIEQPTSVKKEFDGIRRELKDELSIAKLYIERQNQDILSQKNLVENLEKVRAEQQLKINTLESDITDKQSHIDNLQNEICSLQYCVDKQRMQLKHRSVRIVLGMEDWIDRFNHTFGLGKYKRKDSPKPVASNQEEPMASISYDAWYEDNIDYSKCITDVKPIVFHLPQFHAFKENDEWWGKGFTEWTNTRKSKPRFMSHYQPREPHDDFGYYDLSDWKALDKQARLARQHGIYGFCFYRYWFSGKTLMEKPLNLLLEHPEIDINYCLCWANENWTRKWDGESDNVLIGQSYENDSVQYIADLKPFLEDPRYIRVDGRPVIIIYRPNLLPDASKTFKRWREWARDNGIGEILIWIQRGVATMGQSVMVEGADAEIEFPPSGTADFDQYDITRVGADKGTGNLIGYRKLVNNVLAGNGCVEKFNHKVYRGVTLGWDNSPRREQGFWATWGFSLYDYYRWLKYVVQYTRTHQRADERFFFINAWNEWAEGTYLEPDKRFGYSSINVTSRAIFDMPLNPRIEGCSTGQEIDVNEQKKAENLISRNLSLFPYSLYSMYHAGCDPMPGKVWDECNKLDNPVLELKNLHKRFIQDNKRVFDCLSLKRVMLSEMPLRETDAPAKGIGIHLHLFYQDMIPFFKQYLANIPMEFDLLISIPKGTDKDLAKVKTQFEDLEKVNNVIVKSCPNKGRDIAPLICTFREEMLSYDYIAHIHSKKSLHTATHNIWADFILRHLMGTPDNISRILRMMDDNVGLISPPDFLMMPEHPSGWGSNMEYAQKLINLGQINIDLKDEFPIIEFPQGSMFWGRTDYLKKMFELPITYDDFPKEPIGVDGTIAHAFERLFYIWGIDSGMQTRQVFLDGEESQMFMQR